MFLSSFFQNKIIPVLWLSVTLLGAWQIITLTDRVRQLGDYPSQPLRFCLRPLVSPEQKILVILSD